MSYGVRNYYSGNQTGWNNGFNNFASGVGLPVLLGLGLGPLWGIAALLSRNTSNTNIININTRRNNNTYY